MVFSAKSTLCRFRMVFSANSTEATDSNAAACTETLGPNASATAASEAGGQITNAAVSIEPGRLATNATESNASFTEALLGMGAISSKAGPSQEISLGEKPVNYGDGPVTKTTDEHEVECTDETEGTISLGSHDRVFFRNNANKKNIYQIDVELKIFTKVILV
ncbi:unnamed protein product [Cuscuta epithymum]|uniref:Uncharacterized protein n=1 Tax=Cuscuta epithymum TaxID=186058 RepID=A0AAV0GCY9_9ASTE|nr:unnamed protein product [Cuscuta epithymum]